MGCHIYLYKKQKSFNRNEIHNELFSLSEKELKKIFGKFYTRLSEVEDPEQVLELYNIAYNTNYIYFNGFIYENVESPWLRLPPFYYDKIITKNSEVDQLIHDLLNETHYYKNKKNTYCTEYSYTLDQLEWIKIKFKEDEMIIRCE